jgi:hypothetical protein
MLFNVSIPNPRHFSPEDAGSIFLQNVCIQPKDYIAQKPRRPPTIFTHIAQKTLKPIGCFAVQVTSVLFSLENTLKGLDFLQVEE